MDEIVGELRLGLAERVDAELRQPDQEGHARHVGQLGRCARGQTPQPERCFAEYNAKVVPHADEVYRYLQLDTAGRFDAVYGRRDS
jgi:hypothetical protein